MGLLRQTDGRRHVFRETDTPSGLADKGQYGTVDVATITEAAYTDSQGKRTVLTSDGVPAASPGLAHLLGGTTHIADTLANLNTKVSDATLDDISGPRTPTAHGHAASDITSGTLTEARGGTGQSIYVIGDLLMAVAPTILSTLAGVVTGNVLISGGAGSAFSWGKVGLTTHVSGTLAVGNGGTGVIASTGSGSSFVLSTTPTFTTSIITPLVIGGSGAGQPLTLRATLNAFDGDIIFETDPTTERARILSTGEFGIGTSNPQAALQVDGAAGASVGGFPSGLMHVTSSSAAEFANSVITGHNLFGGNKQLWYLGSVSGSSDDIAFINRQVGSLSLHTSSGQRLLISDSGFITLKGSTRIAGTTATTFLELVSGSTAPVSAASEGRLRYNATAQKWQASENASTYMDFVGLPAGYVRGAAITWVSVTTIKTGTTGETTKLRDKDDTFDISFSGELSAVITTAGKGGLDTGAEAADTWYALHVIADSTGVNAPDVVLSTSVTTPTLPAGYNKSRRVAWVRNNPTSNFLKFFGIGKSARKRIHYDEDSANVRPLNNGNATVFTTVDASAFVPPTVERIVMRADFDTGAGAATDDVRFRHPASIAGSPISKIQVGVVTTTSINIPTLKMLLDSTQNFAYAVINALNRVSVIVQGWEDEL